MHNYEQLNVYESKMLNMNVWSELSGTKLRWLVFLKCDVFEYILITSLSIPLNLSDLVYDVSILRMLKKLSMEIFYWLLFYFCQNHAYISHL